MRIIPLTLRDESHVQTLLSELGVSKEGIKILAPKSIFHVFKIFDISSWEANIIKQHLLSLGSDAALNRDVLVKKVKTSVIIFGTNAQLTKLCHKLNGQQFQLKEVARQLTLQLTKLAKDRYTLKTKRRSLVITKAIVCGVVNITPDSFSGDGFLKHSPDSKKILKPVLVHVAAMVKAGAKIIDIGGESSRPFAPTVSKQQELQRVIPVVKAIRKEFPSVLLSIDTCKYDVAYAAVQHGIDIVNDITALRKAPKIADLIVKYKLGCILMHMKGTPRTMQKNPRYKDVMLDIIDFFHQRLAFCDKIGINRNQLIIDPGIGFGKRVHDNLKIIQQLDLLKSFGVPVLVGLSRKSFIGKTLNVSESNRLIGSIAAAVIARKSGAHIMRVHDVKETIQALKLAEAIQRA